MKNFLLGVMSTVLFVVLLGANYNAEPDYSFKVVRQTRAGQLPAYVNALGGTGYEIVAVENGYIYMQKADD